MGAERFLAGRYIRPRLNLVTVISIISIGGIAVGVWALICVLSVFNGFNKVVTGLIIGFDAHVRVTATAPGGMDPEPILSLVRADEGVVSAVPFISGRSAIITRGGLQVVQVRGLRPEDIARGGLGPSIRSGRFGMRGRSTTPPLVVGFILSNSLETAIGDTLSLLSQSGLEESLTQFAQPTIVRAIVTGVFESTFRDFDAYIAYTDLATAARLFDLPKGVMGVEIRLTDIDRSPEYAAQLGARLGPGYRVESWRDLHSDLFAVMELERWGAYIILSLIVIVAAFNVLGSMTMSVIEKRADIGILKAMGATDGDILRTWLIAGSAIGLVGTFLGMLWGIATVMLQQDYGFVRLRSGYFIISALPVEMRTSDLVMIAATALLLAAVASLYPARRAARLVPVDAIRSE